MAEDMSSKKVSLTLFYVHFDQPTTVSSSPYHQPGSPSPSKCLGPRGVMVAPRNRPGPNTLHLRFLESMSLPCVSEDSKRFTDVSIHTCMHAYIHTCIHAAYAYAHDNSGTYKLMQSINTSRNTHSASTSHANTPSHTHTHTRTQQQN